MIAFKEIEAVIWDLDNTITDSRENHFQAWDTILQRYQIPHSRERFEAHYGMSNLEVIKNFFEDRLSRDEIQNISDEKEEEFRRISLKSPNKILPGVMDWLGYCNSSKIIQAVASSSPMKNIIVQLHSLGIGDYFHVICTGFPLPQGKPHPQVFINASAGLGKDPEHCLVIEDTLHGIEAALRASMHCVLVRNEDPREQEQIHTLARSYARIEHQYLCLSSLAEIQPHTLLQ